MTRYALTSTGNSAFNKFFFNLIFILAIQFCHASTELKIENISFRGNSFFTKKNILKVIKSQVNSNFNPRLMRLDEILINNLYLRNGFLQVFVSSEFQRNADKISIIYNIQEGNRYFLNQLIFQGNKLLSDAEMRKRISYNEGKPIEPQKIDEGLKKIENYYFNNGKPFVKIDERTHITSDSLVDFIVDVQENQTVIIDTITFSGLISVKRHVVRRELEIKQGEVYSKKKIENSQRNLYGTGLFNFVNFSLIELDTAKIYMKLSINVMEKKSKWVGVRFGIAYEQQIIYGGTFDIGVEGGHRNLFGTGRSAALHLIQSLSYDFNRNKLINPKNQYSFTYVEPKIFYTRTRGTFQVAFFQARPSSSVSYDLWTAALKIDREITRDWSVIGEIRFQDVNTDSVELLSQSGDQDEIYSIGVGLVGDKRDNYLNPSSGHITEVQSRIVYSENVDIASAATTISRFLKIIMLWNRYQPFTLNRKWTLASRIRVGTIFGFGESIRVPTTERFYLGGASSVRGYSEQLLGPVIYDENDVTAVGGKYSLLINLELRIPLFWRFYSEFFIDGGNVWIDLKEVAPSTLKFSSGLGLALLTPLGAIRFDYGVKWAPKPPEPPDQVHVGLSWAF
jgi:outer membrane protein insertion porin family